jgi:hypothetical protein
VRAGRIIYRFFLIFDLNGDPRHQIEDDEEDLVVPMNE